MKNQLTLQISVSFKGEVHDLKSELDLDQQLMRSGGLPSFHNWVARSNNIDPYSYLFEAIQIQPVEILEATGLAVDFLQAGQFKTDEFISAWRAEQALPGLVVLAKSLLNEDLEENAALKEALLTAYQQGFEKAQSLIELE